MNAVRMLLLAGASCTLLAFTVQPSTAQIVDPNPPGRCGESSEEGGSYIRFSAEWTSPGGEIDGRIDWEDVKEWLQMLLDAVRGRPGGDPPVPPPPADPPADPPAEPPTDGGGTDDGGEKDTESTGVAGACSRVLQVSSYDRVGINGTDLVIAMAHPDTLGIIQVRLTEPIPLPVRMTQQAGLAGNWFLRPGTYAGNGRVIRLALVRR